jgi:hypothetical protein
VFSDQYIMHVDDDCRQIFSPLTSLPGAEQGMRILGVFSPKGFGGGRAPLLNDQDVTATVLSGGIDIYCDRDVDATSVSRPTAFVSVEIPFTTAGQQPAGVVVAYQTISLVGALTVRGPVISWQPSAATGGILPQIAALRGQTDRGMLCRLVLKGNFIWSADADRLYLDGDNYGTPNPRAGGTGLSFPTGDRRRGGDFESWFWLLPDDKTKEKEKEKEKEKDKDTKETKEKDKEKDKEKEKESKEVKEIEKRFEKITDIGKLTDKIHIEKTRDIALPQTSLGSPGVAADGSVDVPQRRAFIRPEERPDLTGGVGRPPNGGGAR